MRELLEDNRRLLGTIDEDYEEQLLEETMLIPEQLDETILDILEAVKVVVRNINFVQIQKDLNKNGGLVSRLGVLRFNVNIFNEFCKVLEMLDLTPTDRARIKNMVNKYRPLITCVDFLVSDPFALAKRIARIQLLSKDDVNIL